MLAEKLKNKNLILASKSPRRQQFLKDLNLNFTIKLKEIKEIYPNTLKGKEITNYLAKLKTNAFSNLKKNDILVTSDTIVWFKNKALGKPKNKEEAIKMLQKLSGKKHQVFTSVCLRSTKKEIIFSDATTVYIKKLSLKEIEYYIENHKPFDKAGSYGIQEWFGYIAVKKIKGSFFNVMGFPVHKFYKELLRF
ncbi:MAG: Maf family nucleotide pyrophosphatase [Flavobacteriaceae bacterium]|nr:Maf family nucleotide pyrophosphatase [Flavobacteriaceae bacterium]